MRLDVARGEQILTYRALDFLLLCYTPPVNIAPLLPAPTISKYQRIFNFLLKIARVDLVLRSLTLDVLHPTAHHQVGPKNGVDAIFTGTSGRLVDQQSGVFPCGSSDQKRLQDLRLRMMQFVSSVQRYMIDMAVGNTWGTFRSRMEEVEGRSLLDPTTATQPGHHEALAMGDMSDGASDLSDWEDQDLPASPPDPDYSGSPETIQGIMTLHDGTLDKIHDLCLLSPRTRVSHMTLMAMFEVVLQVGQAIKLLQSSIGSLAEAAESLDASNGEWRRLAAQFKASLRDGDPLYTIIADL